jgi:hypothetical protein
LQIGGGLLNNSADFSVEHGGSCFFRGHDRSCCWPNPWLGPVSTVQQQPQFSPRRARRPSSIRLGAAMSAAAESTP